MTEKRKITSFDITKGQTIRFGRYAGLENLLHSYLLELETVFYDLLAVPFKVSFKVKEYNRYLDYLQTKEHPAPMFIFELPPLKGNSLLFMENSFVNTLLARDQLIQNKKAEINNEFLLNASNYAQVKSVVETLLAKLCSSWETLKPIDYKLKRLVSHPIKARVLSPNEPCIVVPVEFKWMNFKTSIEFCFSTVQLDPIMDLISRHSLMVSDRTERVHPEVTEYFEEVINRLPYEIQGIFGSVLANQKELEESLETGSVIPIQNELGVKVSLKVNGEALIAGVPGSTKGYYSVKVEDTLEALLESARKDKKAFQELQFNQA